MALLLKLPIHHPPSLPNSTHQRPKNASFRPNYVKFRSIPTIVNITTPMCRRSANWQPSIWDFKFIQSLSSDYEDDVHVRRAEKLKEKVRKLFNAEDMTSFELLELVDTSQRLGISYHFDKEIKNSLETVVMHSNFGTKEGLYATSLLFRLLRQHGYPISQDVFLGFKDDSGKFDVSLSKDIKGLLNLYEASYLAVEGEIIMDEARAFASKHLNNIVKSKTPIPHKLAKQVSYSLELPLHLRMLRLDARWYIEGGFIDVNSDLLEFPKLDFNMVQATHQNDLREVSKWWRDIGLGSHPELRFARDRLMECFLWTIGVNFNPEFRNTRRGLTKINALITTIDDVYDIYGSLEELELFTDVIERWDINAIEELPYYMKLCFTTLYNTVNEMAYITLKEQGLDIRHQLRHKWADLCKAYLVEAKWYDRKYTPTLEEYLNNGYISITGPVILVHVHFLANQEITEAALQCIQGYPDIIRWSSMIVRLCDDLGTSSGEMERGDVPKSIQCYMNETGCSEELAREHIKHLIVETWTKMNKERVDDSIFPHRFREEAVNLARMAQCMYLYGDGHGVPDQETKERVIALLVEPIVI